MAHRLLLRSEAVDRSDHRRSRRRLRDVGDAQRSSTSYGVDFFVQWSCQSAIGTARPAAVRAELGEFRLGLQIARCCSTTTEASLSADLEGRPPSESLSRYPRRS